MGSISNIGPKTSWAARDRPELNLEKLAIAMMPGISPHGGGRRLLSVRRMAARRRAKRGASSQHRAPTVAHIRPTTAQHLAARSSAGHRAETTPSLRLMCAASAQRDSPRKFGRNKFRRGAAAATAFGRGGRRRLLEL
ncbi:hypothetical protein F511_29305 [Dorcoceras hygrometricum]|uniref:Uncharacterized protein n=1 Tax=Dorcoceras hygrometricum TaxID=472368 RepID=A0A2Z7CTV4_9LAMI|nr:hypothetical protein F511_29305 [Dorcoceras hygrometricum]